MVLYARIGCEMDPRYPALLNDSFRPQWERLLHLRTLGFKPGSILDIGAHHGGWSVLVGALWPEADVLSIEANEACRGLLAQHVRDFKIVALSDTAGQAFFWKSTESNTEGSSFFREQSNHAFIPVKVETTTLDLLAGDTVYDFIKMDCQGAEAQIIQGGTSTLRKAEFVLLEMQIQEYNQGAPYMLEIMNMLDGCGFRLYDIVELHRNVGDVLLQVDALFARKESPVFALSHPI